MVPTVLLPLATPFTCQVTAVLVKLLTIAVNAVVPPRRTWPLPLTAMEGWVLGEETLDCDGPQPLSASDAPSKKTKHELGCSRRLTCKIDPLANAPGIQEGKLAYQDTNQGS